VLKTKKIIEKFLFIINETEIQLLVGKHVRNGAVEGHRAVDLKLEDVQVVQTVRIGTPARKK
jgi:hypothetical protein